MQALQASAPARTSALPQPSPRPAPRVWTGIAGALVLLFGADALIFRSGFYATYLEPESSAGKVELAIALESSRPKTAPNQVLVFGDSRMRFLPEVAGDEGWPYGWGFGSLVVPGSAPRGWWYMLRAQDRHARGYAAIVLPVDTYDDIDQRDDLAERLVDLHQVAGQLRLRDLVDFPWSYRSWRARWQAFRGTLLPGTVYQSDIRAFLRHPLDRLAKVREYEDHYAEWAWNYEGEEGSLAGLSVNWAARQVVFPPGLNGAARGALYDVLMRAPEIQTGRTAAYRREWFGRIVERYRGSRTRVVFVRLPRGPVARGGSDERGGVIGELARRNPHVLVLDQHLFDSLERPDFYADGLHLNRRGSIELSRILGDEVRRRLAQ